MATEVGSPANKPGGAGMPANKGWDPGTERPSPMGPLNPGAMWGNCLCNSAKGSPRTLERVRGGMRVSVTLCLLFLGVTTRERASSCSGGDRSRLTGEGEEW